MKDKKIFRSIDDYMVAGICGGLAKYFNIDSTLVRIIFVLLLLSGGCGILIYLILWLVIPKEKGVEKEIKMDTKIKKPGRVNVLGVVLILVGLVAIWNQISPITIDWNFFWPGLLVLIGILVLFK